MHPGGEQEGEQDPSWEAARAWAGSGVMALCGYPDGPPLVPPLSVPKRLGEVVAELERLSTSRGRGVRVCWEAALAGRAAMLGFRRRGRTSANGTCRLLRAADREVALSLPRPSDIDLIPALTSGAVSRDPWDAVARMASETPAAQFVDHAGFLGLAAAVAGERVAGDPYLVTQDGEKQFFPAGSAWTVVDLSGLWAGPLAARILAETGAQVVKVEDPGRVDGARQNPSFYSWIHSDTESSVHIDFGSLAGRDQLAGLLTSAAVVIEGSRPRALAQMGLAPEQLGLTPGQVWLSITGHGRRGPGRHRIGFGDDGAIAGGLFCRDPAGVPVFCGDAIADHVTGLVAAVAVLKSLSDGGGQVIDVSLSGVAAWVTAGHEAENRPKVEQSENGWLVRSGSLSVPVAGSPRHMRFVESP